MKETTENTNDKKFQIPNHKLHLVLSLGAKQISSNDQNPNDRNKKTSNYDLEERTYQFAKKSNFLELRKNFSSIIEKS
ncbi:MAG: hypothetical protein ACE5WD_00245 [Candidatus Aminicenantia bacterium]